MTEIIEGTATEVPQPSAMVIHDQPRALQSFDSPTQDPIRAIGLMDENRFKVELETLVRGKNRMLQLTRDLLRPGIDYAVIPGTKDPSLLQPGAEQLAMFHRLIPEHVQTVSVIPVPGHPDRIDVDTTTLLHLGSLDGPVVGTAKASASTYEDRYRWRNSDRTCPRCGAAAIIRGNPKYAPRQGGQHGPVLPGYDQGGWLCWKKKDGCGTTFPDADPVGAQQAAKVENEEPHALRNTVMQISAKRGFVGAIRHTLGITDLFTQDIEEMPGFQRPQDAPGADGEPPPPTDSAARAPAASRAAPPAQGGGRRGTTAVYPGELQAVPDGTRSTPDGPALRFRIKVGRSNHHVELVGPMAGAVMRALHAAGEGVLVTVQGTRYEEEWEGRLRDPQKPLPLMKVIRDVTSVQVGTDQPIRAGDPAPAPMTPDAAPDDGGGLFDEDDLPGVPSVVLQTGDPAGTADLTGLVSEIRWDKAGDRDFVYMEVTDAALRRWRVAVSAETAEEQFWSVADGSEGSFTHAGMGREVRVIGGWSKRGDIVVATVVLDAAAKEEVS